VGEKTNNFSFLTKQLKKAYKTKELSQSGRRERVWVCYVCNALTVLFVG